MLTPKTINSRWCERGYCEDCLDWDKTDLLGENLKEYELLGFPAVPQAFYIKCPSCHDHHVESPEARDFCTNITAEIDARYEAFVEEQALVAAATQVAKKPTVPPTPAESLTDATTLDNSSGISTPRFGGELAKTTTSSRKRKAAPESFNLTPTTPSKRSKRILA